MKGYSWVVGIGILITFTAISVETYAEPRQVRTVERKARAFRPIQPLERTLTLDVKQAESNGPVARWFTEPEPAAEPRFAGARRDVGRIPAPSIPDENLAPSDSSLPDSPSDGSTQTGTALIPPPPIPEGTETSGPLATPIVSPRPDSVPSETTTAAGPLASSSQAAESTDGFFGPPVSEGDSFPRPKYTEPEGVDDVLSTADSPPETPSEDPLPEDSTETESSPEPGNTGSDAPLSLSRLRKLAHELAAEGLTYKWGAEHPDQGGMDCSGVVQYVLEEMGVEGVPRTSYDQYYWLKREKLLDDVHGRKAEKKLFEKLSPGDLIFWGNTWNSGHKVSHVMIYLGWNEAEDKHYIFGAQGKKSKGLFGNGVDIFELDPDRGRLIGHGKIPGLAY